VSERYTETVLQALAEPSVHHPQTP
jgi:hypothetical protein